jgi:uncharacterized membrane protein YphA (DoxX/SURF4 family)
MQHKTDSAVLLARLTLAATFLSAVASRLNLWGSKSSGWQNFLQYTAEVNSFAPASIIPLLAVSATVLETLFSLLLIAGYKIKWTATGAATLTLLFALAMAYSYGIKEPLDYSVFAFSAAAFLLSRAVPDKWSLDVLIKRNKQKQILV